MSDCPRFRLSISRPALARALSLTLAWCGLVTAGCQKKEEHPAFVGACESGCSQTPGIVVGNGSAGSGNPDAGPASLTGQVLLLSDDSFVHATLYASRATISADGASGSPVSADWDGADPYVLDNVSSVATNWLSVRPALVGGDPLPTYQAVRTNAVSQLDLALISAATLDDIFNTVSAVRDPNSAQVVLFFASAGTGGALAGLHVTMPLAHSIVYRSGATWVVDQGTGVTDPSGLVLFGNVDASNASGNQVVTVSRAATATSSAADGGQFVVKVVEGAASIATASVLF